MLGVETVRFRVRADQHLLDGQLCCALNGWKQAAVSSPKSTLRGIDGKTYRLVFVSFDAFLGDVDIADELQGAFGL